MKQWINFLTILFGLGCLATSTHAYMLDEKQLFTKKKGCYINYLTEKNTSGWYIQTNREECGKEGFLSGYHQITIYNGFSKPIENLSGYFSKGYWTGDDFIKNAEFTRFSEELGVQKAIFALKPNKEDKIEYFAQILTKKTSSGTYPPFKVCNPIKILGIHTNKNDFKDPQFLQRIFNHVEQEARLVCPKEDNVMLFLTTKQNPKQEDIVTFVDMNLKSRKHRIVHTDTRNKTPTPQFIKHEKSETISVFISDNLNNNILKKTEQKYNPDEFPETDISEEKQDIIQTENPTENPSSQISEPENQPTLPNKKTAVSSETKTNMEPIQEKSEPNNDLALKAAAYFNSTGDDNIQPITEEQSASPLKKSYSQSFQKKNLHQELSNQKIQANVTDLSANVWPVRHIFLASKVLNAPVLAQAAVHIDQMAMDNTGTADFPTTADVEGSYTQPGWHIIKGYFVAYKTTEKHAPVGLIKILDVNKCSLSVCQKERP